MVNSWFKCASIQSHLCIDPCWYQSTNAQEFWFVYQSNANVNCYFQLNYPFPKLADSTLNMHTDICYIGNNNFWQPNNFSAAMLCTYFFQCTLSLNGSCYISLCCVSLIYSSFFVLKPNTYEVAERLTCINKVNLCILHNIVLLNLCCWYLNFLSVNCNLPPFYLTKCFWKKKIEPHFHLFTLLILLELYWCQFYHKVHFVLKETSKYMSVSMPTAHKIDVFETLTT